MAGYLAILSISGGSPPSKISNPWYELDTHKEAVYSSRLTHDLGCIPFHVPLSRRPIFSRNPTMSQVIQLELLHERVGWSIHS